MLLFIYEYYCCIITISVHPRQAQEWRSRTNGLTRTGDLVENRLLDSLAPDLTHDSSRIGDEDEDEVLSS
jgi:hypothetical protein